jgi:hypothetical protein
VERIRVLRKYKNKLGDESQCWLERGLCTQSER